MDENMSGTPKLLYLHTIHASRGHDATRERELIENAVGVPIEFAKTFAESKTGIRDAEIVFTTGSGIPESLFASADELRWIQTVSSGIDGFDMSALEQAGVILTNAAGINGEPVAEQTLGYMLMFERKIHRGYRQQLANTWERYEGGELLDKTVGIIGVGEIGGRIAELCNAFGMEVLGVKRDVTNQPASLDCVYPPDELETVLPQSDYVVVACPLTDQTRGMFGDKEFGAMKDDGVIINVARGEITEFDSLTYAVQQHVIGGAALDVYPTEPYSEDSPLWNLSNVIMTPHMAGSNPKKPDRIAEIFTQNFEAYQAGNHDEMPTRIIS